MFRAPYVLRVAERTQAGLDDGLAKLQDQGTGEGRLYCKCDVPAMDL